MVTITPGVDKWLADEKADNLGQHAAGGDDQDYDAEGAKEWQAAVRANNAEHNAKRDAERAAERAEEGIAKLSVQLGYLPFPRQRAFHMSGAKYRLFGGAAGPGKSKALLMETILKANENPGANTLLLRRTFPELEQSLLLYFRREVPRELYKNFNESKHVVTWLNGSTTRFGYCQNENDVYQYQGAEFLFIGIDELTLFTLRQWQFLTSRNRCPIANSKPGMAAATNPGNIGHAWVKSLWIDKKAAPGMDNPNAYDPGDYDFVPARVGDNPIYANDENYLKTLRALPTHLRRAFLDGDWEVFAGQYFDNFDYARHVIRAESLAWQSWWPRWISVDWGFEHPAAAYWHAAAPGGAENRKAAPSSAGGPLQDQEREMSRPFARDDNQEQAAGDGSASPNSLAGRSDATPLRYPSAPSVVTYREYVTHRTSPRDLAREIIRRSVQSGSYSAGHCNSAVIPSGAARDVGLSQELRPRGAVESAVRVAENATADPSTSGRPLQDQEREKSRPFARDDNGGRGGAPAERIDAIYLSPDAFARRTDEASIAEQMGDIFAAAGLPRPTPADDDRIGGWMLMYQMLSSAKRGPQVEGESSLGNENDQAWLITDNCAELIRTLPSLVRDPARVEDIEKMDGDDPADAARYGLKSRYAMLRGGPDGWRSRMPLVDRIAAHEYSEDPTVRAMQARKFSIEESRGHAKPVKFPRRHHW